ncbi:MAG: N-succinylarginine dihydrolase, partial [SAR324 cluster bacterium]|nr:N-succinylarginine dihydrolase [SAR324 cluster bacterium]
MPDAREINFDGLVGPTHNYAGLSVGNLASVQHKATVSNPREAALQGLRKMKFLADMGIDQGIIPPHERPSVSALRNFGFTGRNDAAILEKAARDAPDLLSACSSASSMWTANAATFSPSADSLDGRAHFTPANLISKLHRSLEADQTARILKSIFNNDAFFVHHPPLSGGHTMRDEGAANHTRLCASFDQTGLQLFVYGASALHPEADGPTQFPARQSLEASRTVARLHQLSPEGVIFARQNVKAIDAGVFHNDVIAMSHLDRICYHERAYRAPGRFRKWLRGVGGGRLRVRVVTERELSLDDAVASYVFNSQVVAPPEMGGPLILAPEESRENAAAERLLMRLVEEGWAERVEFIDIRQSMRNGGGPACLRLRVPLTAGELGAVRGRVMLDQTLYDELAGWVVR